MNIIRSRAALFATLVFCASLFPGASGAQPVQAVAPDVLVVGGTPAGVAAAVAAARSGESVELVSARPDLGGILTDAMMDQWDLNLAPDGQSLQGGLFREIYARLGDSFTPAQAAATFAALVAHEPNIRIVTGAAAVAVATSAAGSADRTLERVDFRRPDSAARFSVAARAVIDATDDGDVAALAGARYDLGRQDTGRDERMQAVTLIFTVTGVDWARIQFTYDPVADGPGGATERRAWGYADELRAYHPSDPALVVDDLNLGHEDGGSVTVNAIDVLGIDGRNDRDIARARMLTEREAPRLVAFLRERIAGFAGARVGRFADTVYVRETRHFAGLERLTTGDVWSGRVPNDTIGLGSYPIDLHPVVAGEAPAFAPIRHVYGIPFGTLVPRGFANLLIASPAISASHLASGSARIIPTTIEEGEAAGTAAALALQTHVDFPTLSTQAHETRALQAELERDGVILAPQQIARATRMSAG